MLEVIEARYGNQSHRREELQPEPNCTPIHSTLQAHVQEKFVRRKWFYEQPIESVLRRRWSMANEYVGSHHPARANTRGYDAKKYVVRK